MTDAGAHVTPTGEQVKPRAADSSSPASLLVAPWRGILRPAAGVRAFLSARLEPLMGAYLLHALLCGGGVAGWILASDLYTQDWTGGAYATDSRRIVIDRSFSEVWAMRHAQGPIGGLEITVMLVASGMFVANLFAAWLHLPLVHRTGSAWDSYKRSVRIVASGMGTLILLVFLCGLMLVGVDDLRVWLESYNLARDINLFFFLSYLSVIFSLVGLLWWLGRAVRAYQRQEEAPESRPVCEGCGYDLSHVPREGRCSECGRNVDASLIFGEAVPAPTVRCADPSCDRTWTLSPERRFCSRCGQPGRSSSDPPLALRVGLLWEAGIVWEAMSLASVFFQTFTQLLTQPSLFYRRLTFLNDDAPARRFAWVNFGAIILGTWGWMLGMTPEDSPRLWLATCIALMVGLAGWGTHRLIAALSVSWWFFRGTVDDGMRFRKVLLYETAFLWFFCMLNGVLLSGMFLTDGPWLSNWWGAGMFYRVFGMTPEEVVGLYGNILLGLLWLWRYVFIVRAIRWSNY